MSESIVKTVNELLNEEKWTRAALNSYTINNFMDLDKLIEETNKSQHQAEIQAICEEHLKHTKNSIIALYIAGIIALTKQLVDDSNLIILINIFVDNHKWNIVEYLCNRMLEFGENKYALRTLADCFENKNEQENQYKVWERLIKVDYEEAEIVRLLAEKKEQEGAKPEAIEYYKKAIHRFINKKMFSNVKDIWEKLVEYIPEDIDYFFSIERKIVKVLSEERAASLLNLLYPYYKKREKWDTAIEILKRILDHEPKNQQARKDIVDCFREKYKQHSQIEEYIRISNLNQSWRNVHDAIMDFEKHISFDAGNYVYHRSWGIGKIATIKDDVFVIAFPGKPEHKMSLKMAVGALEILGFDHIWVVKNTVPAAELRERVKKEPAWILKTIVKSFNNSADMKRIKAELVPDVLSLNEWSKWSVDARKILKTDPTFGNIPDKLDTFTVRDKPISFEEKTFNKFKAEKNFFDRIQTLRDFYQNAEPDSDYFAEMFSYFTAFLKSPSAATEYIISSYLQIQRIVSVSPYLNPGLDYSFKDLFERIDNPAEVFERIPDPEIKRDLLISIKRYIANWPQLYAELFHVYQNKFIIDELVAGGQWEVLGQLFNQIVTQHRDYREAFVWLARNVADEPWFNKLEILREKILIGLIHLLDITFREINNKREVSHNRKLNKQIEELIFGEEKLIHYILEAGEESITRLYTLVEDVKELKPSRKIQLKQRIKEAYPLHKFRGELEKEKVSRGLMVTHSGYERKQKELRHIIEFEIPENSKEIGVALSKGDLRENAEYKAALEKQEMLKSAASKLQEELQKAQIFNLEQVNVEAISFGTQVRLRNMITEATEEYFLFGPWESDPGKNIISYLSPLGLELLNHRAGERLKFIVNEQEFDYFVDKIEKAEIPSVT